MENLITIYKRAMQYCVAKFGGEPSELHLLEDGSFKVVYHKYSRGEYTEEEYFDASCLTQDLDSVYEERKRAEEEAREKHKIESEKRERERKKQEEERRKSEYQKLRKEFDEKSEIDFAEWLNNNEWVKRNHTHPNHVGKYWSNIHCEYKTIEELLEMFRLEKINKKLFI